jgi:hypothetical protein
VFTTLDFPVNLDGKFTSIAYKERLRERKEMEKEEKD